MEKSCRHCVFRVKEGEIEFCYQDILEVEPGRSAEPRKLDRFPQVPEWCRGGIWLEDEGDFRDTEPSPVADLDEPLYESGIR
jgi:hypothetical protein